MKSKILLGVALTFWLAFGFVAVNVTQRNWIKTVEGDPTVLGTVLVLVVLALAAIECYLLALKYKDKPKDTPGET